MRWELETGEQNIGRHGESCKEGKAKEEKE